MAVDLPTHSEIVNRSRGDITRYLPDLDPTISVSEVRTIVDSNSNRHYDNTLLIGQLQKELFPTENASVSSIQRWANYERLTPFSAAQSSGNAVFTGVVGIPIPAETTFTNSSGSILTTINGGTISNITIAIDSLVRNGSTVTATVVGGTEVPFAQNISITVAGADQEDYNGDHQITVLTENSFSFEIETEPVTPATGTITASCNCFSIDLLSDEFSADQNLGSGSPITLRSPIIGVNNIGYVSLAGLTGGRNTETNTSLLARTLESRSNVVANFNPAAIRKQITDNIQGVTRIKIKRVTPYIGAVTILFVRDNDDNIIPDASEVLEVKNSVLEILPATSEEDDVFVLSPTPIEEDFIFSSITPDTETMRTAIQNNITAFFEDSVEIEQSIQEDNYRAAITNTIDTSTGETLTAFNLSSPSGDILVGINSIAIPGSIVFQ